MVDRIINDMGQDSAYVQVYFFKPMKTYQELNIKINNSAPVNYKLENDTIFSNLKSVTFGINTTGQNQDQYVFPDKIYRRLHESRACSE